jgi:hypothetical protein
LLILEDESLADDGVAAGQTVLHVYLHPLPRYLQGDSFPGTRNDEVFNKLEKQEGALPQDLTGASDSHTGPRLLEPLRVDADAMREPRTLEDMGHEARWLPGFLEAIERRYVNSAVHRSVILASGIQGNTRCQDDGNSVRYSG